jgi:hypothetical protein
MVERYELEVEIQSVFRLKPRVLTKNALENKEMKKVRA